MKHLRTAMMILIGAVVFATSTLARAGENDIPLPMVYQHLNMVYSVSDADKANEFYGDLLGLARIRDLNFPGKTYMIRYMGGTTEVKLIVTGEDLPSHPGGIDTALGVRWVTFNMPAEKKDSVVSKLKKYGYPILPSNDSRGDAIATRDGDDNHVEIIFHKGVPSDALKKQFEIGLTVSDLEESRTFISTVLGYKENEPLTLKDGQIEISFQAGDTRLKLRSFDKELTSVTAPPFEEFGLNLVQHIVRDVPAVRELFIQRGGNIHTEPFQLGKLATIMFMDGPDGILYEFAGPPIAAKK
ncbi:MAG: hypothetical protein COA73_09685 [Candidatus Hydrogenedentota bacterium]|nr:MAG: hypothetical protein COA73_09685 [Candidatus Hydrogenedentota bacterium]